MSKCGCSRCLSCCLGCRKAKATPDENKNTVCDVIWLFILSICHCFSVFGFIFWVIFGNEFFKFDSKAYDYIGIWIHWYNATLGVTTLIMVYLAILYIVSILHLSMGMRVYLHYVHRVVLLILTAFLIAVLGVVSWKWNSNNWILFKFSLNVIGPLLPVAIVCYMTLMTGPIAGYWFTIKNIVGRIIVLVVFSIVMVFLYLCPLMINSPCVADELPAKPGLVAHRGDNSVAPENTISAFRSASERNAVCLESDVRISLDGIAFMMHDDTLKRTTDVATVYPGRENEHCSNFTITEIQQLKAGDKFIQDDPFDVISSLPEDMLSEFRRQRVLLLSDYLTYAKNNRVAVMWDQKSIMKGHPHEQERDKIAAQAILQSGIPPKLVWWLVKNDGANNLEQYGVKGYTKVAAGAKSVAWMKSKGYDMLNVGYYQVTVPEIRNLTKSKIWVNIWTINSKWLYSMYWCVGVGSITTDYVTAFSEMTSPVFHLTRKAYLILWVAVDIVSLLSVIFIFIIICVCRKSRRQLDDPEESIPMKSEPLRVDRIAKYKDNDGEVNEAFHDSEAEN
ncbi:glycerophosphoinositol inositolphosphodiesterase GDPD2-like [Tubulanus polymorphus]|uniref:glycerophosphoinositol inositolphosphodiesterase GDPD2-like n=1 Tax=Tubulanus polymorphus TaxID=672921 RepID=UPI003DA4999C